MLRSMTQSRRSWAGRPVALAAAFGIVLAGVSPVLADDDDHDDDRPRTGLERYYDMLESEPTYSTGNEAAVAKLVQRRNIAIPYDYIATLMRIPNAFGEGVACVVCHSSNEPTLSFRGLDLTTCEGIKTGTTEPPVRKLFEPGDAENSLLRRYLRNNRMPYGVPFDAPRDTENIRTIKAWIDDGAKNDAFFQENVLPLFQDPQAFGGFQSCTDCHLSNQEPPSFHELDLTSFDGIMLGADAIANAAEGKPPAQIVEPGNAEASPLYQRLVENRMPAGIEPSENRDHPNIDILMQWIDQGAKCD